MTASLKILESLYLRLWNDQKRCSGDSRRIPTNLPELQVIMDHVQHIVKNTYLFTKNGTIRRQKIGLPMGTNSAPELANLTLYVDESQYIDGLVQSPNAQDLELAKDHAFTQRLIDDLKTWSPSKRNVWSRVD